MRLAIATLTLLVLCLAIRARADAPATQPTITWQPWSDDVFDRAKKENKFVLMPAKNGETNYQRYQTAGERGGNRRDRRQLQR